MVLYEGWLIKIESVFFFWEGKDGGGMWRRYSDVDVDGIWGFDFWRFFFCVLVYIGGFDVDLCLVV